MQEYPKKEAESGMALLRGGEVMVTGYKASVFQGKGSTTGDDGHGYALCAELDT